MRCEGLSGAVGCPSVLFSLREEGWLVLPSTEPHFEEQHGVSLPLVHS